MKFKTRILGIELQIVARRSKTAGRTTHGLRIAENPKLNLGPGPNWKKPGNDWYSVDIDPALGDIIVDFQKFERLPFEDNSVRCVYGSHVFEHISIFKSQMVFNELYRVLQKEGILRMVLPDAEKSIREYVNGNYDFLLFQRRRERARKFYKKDYTLFECMKEDFLSPSGQTGFLGENSLAHQNAWDFETLVSDLARAGFSKEKIKKMNFRESQTEYFSFEGTYPSEANEDYRSLYVEAIK